MTTALNIAIASGPLQQAVLAIPGTQSWVQPESAGFTVSFYGRWVTGCAYDDYGCIVGCFSPYYQNPGWGIWTRWATTKLIMQAWANNGTKSLTTGTAVEMRDSLWHRWVMRLTKGDPNDTMEVLQDGLLYGTVTAARVDSLTPSGYLGIGARHRGTHAFDLGNNAKLANLWIVKRTVDDAELAETAGIYAAPDDATLWWPFDEGTGVAVDRMNAINGTLDGDTGTVATWDTDAGHTLVWPSAGGGIFQKPFSDAFLKPFVG